jgi:hypothetical protein
MAIDGTWKIVSKTPMGDQEATAVVSVADDVLTGTVSSDLFGSTEIQDGRVEGDKAFWTLNISSPLQLTLKHEAIFTGDAVVGEVDLGLFGKAAFTGQKV